MRERCRLIGCGLPVALRYGCHPTACNGGDLCTMPGVPDRAVIAKNASEKAYVVAH